MFAAVIQYFRESLQDELSTRTVDGFSYDDVYWVITVPAIWNLKANNIMKMAAKKVCFSLAGFFGLETNFLRAARTLRNFLTFEINSWLKSIIITFSKTLYSF